VSTLGDKLVYWSSKFQIDVSHSNIEAEYHTGTHAVAKCFWSQQVLQELHISIAFATIVYCDNVTVVYMTTDSIHHHHHRTKHVKTDIHFIHEKVALGKF
jgi:hypothetical protein